jgi:4-hydroxy-tetrahydrodipicolinate reductase
MGRAVVRLAAAADDIQVVGAADAPTSPFVGRDAGELGGVEPLGVAVGPDISAALLGADVVVDFSTAGTLSAVLHAASRASVAVVSGTTGIDEAGLAAIDRAAASIPVLWAPNMSVGVELVRELVARAVQALGAGYDVEVVETHHGAKVDAPSGTALGLVAAAQAARPALTILHGRQGRTGPRGHDCIGVHALRGGGVVGDHSVHLLGELERIEITHRAIHRDLFALGALRVARFLCGKPARRYQLADVVA